MAFFVCEPGANPLPTHAQWLQIFKPPRFSLKQKETQASGDNPSSSGARWTVNWGTRSAGLSGETWMLGLPSTHVSLDQLPSNPRHTRIDLFIRQLKQPTCVLNAEPGKIPYYSTKNSTKEVTKFQASKIFRRGSRPPLTLKKHHAN